jgi:hypothetical protein
MSLLFLEGNYQPHDNDERLAMVGTCEFKDLPAMTARLFADAFAADGVCRARQKLRRPFLAVASDRACGSRGVLWTKMHRVLGDEQHSEPPATDSVKTTHLWLAFFVLTKSGSQISAAILPEKCNYTTSWQSRSTVIGLAEPQLEEVLRSDRSVSDKWPIRAIGASLIGTTLHFHS